MKDMEKYGKLHVKRDDEVIVISGDDKGKRGKVVETSPEEGKVIVSGVNVVSKHTKPRKQGDQGGIIKVDGPIYADKVMLYCSKCGKGVRAAHKIENGKKTRVCAKCGAAL
jgi:large subunit ribosomal protein L24